MAPTLSALPEVLQSRIDAASFGDGLVGRVGNSLTQVVDNAAGPAFLKVGRGAAAIDLRREANRLRWIGNRLPVPEVLFFENADPAFLLIRALKGSPSHEWLDVLGPKSVVRMLATTLRSIHRVEVEGCTFRDLFVSELSEAEERLHRGAVDQAEFENATGMTPAKAIDWLHTVDPAGADVFTHGDYCMPNVLIEDGEVSGIVDWGLAGVANPHRDFMSFEVTLRRNLDLSWRALFYDEYQLGDLDEKMIRAYSVLDQFF